MFIKWGTFARIACMIKSKKKTPGKFQKYLEMTEISKAIDDKTKAVQQQVQSASSSIKADNLNVVDAKHK